MKLNVNKMFFVLILFSALFINEDILVFGTIDNQALVNFRLGTQICLTIVMLIYIIYKRVLISRKRLLILFAFAFFVLLSMLWNSDIRSGYLFLIMIYLDCVLLTTIFSFDEIYSYLSKIMYVICLFSLVGYVIALFLPNFLSVFPIIENVDNHEFFFLGLTNVSFRYDTFVRNWGPFREPGVFQAFTTMALVYSLFREKNVVKMKPIVFVLAIVTTFSTAGYIALFLVLFAAFAIRKDRVSKSQRNLIYGVFFVSITGLIYLTLFTDLMYKQSGYGSVFGKIFGTYESLSYSSRMASITVNVKMALDNLVCGKGITYVDEMFGVIAKSMYGRIIRDNTNMLFIQLAKYGIIVFGYTIYRYYVLIRKAYNFGALVWIPIGLAYAVLMFSQNFSYSVLMCLPMFFIGKDFMDEPRKCNHKKSESL